MREATQDELALMAEIKKCLTGAKSSLVKMKALANEAKDPALLVDLQGIHADLDRAHADAAKAALGNFSNVDAVILGPGR